MARSRVEARDPAVMARVPKGIGAVSIVVEQIVVFPDAHEGAVLVDVSTLI